MPGDHVPFTRVGNVTMGEVKPTTDGEIADLEAWFARHPPMENTKDAKIMAILARLRAAEADRDDWRRRAADLAERMNGRKA